MLSIFIPVYNAEKTVQQAIDSVLAQTYPNYELLLIDDASTDGTTPIINQYRDHPQVKIYCNPKNLGVTGNWNRGISLCQGDFIARLDADDYYAPDYLERVITAFKHTSAPDMVFTGANLIFDNGETRTELPYKNSCFKTGTAFLPEVVRYCPVRASSVCVKRHCYKSLGGVRDDLALHHDWEFWVRMAAMGNCIGYIAEPLTHYRVLNFAGCTSTAIVEATSPADCAIWLKCLEAGQLPYQLTDDELQLLKQGMYDIVMMFAAFAMERNERESVEKHLAFARKLLPPGANGSMKARLYARAAEICFMEGSQHLQGWRFLLQSLGSGSLPREENKHLKLLARALFGKTIFEFVRNQTSAGSRFPYSYKS